MKTPPVPPKIDPDPSKPVYRVRPLPSEPPPEAAAVNDDYVTPVMCARPFSSINDIPESVGGLSIRQVGDCLRLLKLERYVDIFVKHDIDGTLLTTLDDAMLTSPDFIDFLRMLLRLDDVSLLHVVYRVDVLAQAVTSARMFCRSRSRWKLARLRTRAKTGSSSKARSFSRFSRMSGKLAEARVFLFNSVSFFCEYLGSKMIPSRTNKVKSPFTVNCDIHVSDFERVTSLFCDFSTSRT